MEAANVEEITALLPEITKASDKDIDETYIEIWKFNQLHLIEGIPTMLKFSIMFHLFQQLIWQMPVSSQWKRLHLNRLFRKEVKNKLISFLERNIQIEFLIQFIF